MINTNSNYNCDGLDPDGCKNVIIRNCHIESHDDAMCLKSAKADKPMRTFLLRIASSTPPAMLSSLAQTHSETSATSMPATSCWGH